MTTAQQGDIVVGVDESAVSVAALRWAMSEAAASGRTVVALRAWTYDPVLDFDSAVTGSPKSVKEIHRRELEDAIALAREDGPDVSVRAEVVEHSPAFALIEASKTASMIVLGSHGRGRLLTMLVGSVAEQCLREASCPVVVIPARTVPEPEKEPVGSSDLEGSYFPGPLL